MITLSSYLSIVVFIILFWLVLLFLLVRNVNLFRSSQHYTSLLDIEAGFADEKTFSPEHVEVPGNALAYYTEDRSDNLLIIESFDTFLNDPEDQVRVGGFRLKGKIIGPIGEAPTMTFSLAYNENWFHKWTKYLRAEGECDEGRMCIVQNGKVLPWGAVPTEGEIDIQSWGFPYGRMSQGWWSIRLEANAGKEIGARLTGFEVRQWFDGVNRPPSRQVSLI